MLKLLTKPYPFLYSLKRNLIIAVFVGLFVALFRISISDELFASQYLILSDIQTSYIFGLITFFCVILIFELFPNIVLSDTQKENWTVFREFGLISLLLPGF